MIQLLFTTLLRFFSFMSLYMHSVLVRPVSLLLKARREARVRKRTSRKGRIIQRGQEQKARLPNETGSDFRVGCEENIGFILHLIIYVYLRCVTAMTGDGCMKEKCMRAAEPAVKTVG